MSQPHEVIIYRNPLEYQLYNSGMLFPLMCGAVVTIVAVVVISKVLEHVLSWQTMHKLGYLPLALGFLCGGLTVWGML